MRTIYSLILSFAILTLLTVSLSSCNKNDDSMPIQQGDSLIKINAIYPQDNWLEVRYNTVISVPINLTIAFYLEDGSRKNVSLTIPAGYRQLENFGIPGGDDYLNVWDYHSYTGIDTSTGVPYTGPVITWNADVDSIRIIKVSCPDSRYGFQILSGNNDWDYYLPVDSKTVLSYIVNGETAFYTDYYFGTSVTTWYHTSSSQYSFYFFNSAFIMGSGASVYPFQTGSVIPIPFLLYNLNGITQGSQPDGPQESTNGSTLQLTITKMTDETYNGAFSGKIWSSRQPDTLVFTNGIIENAPLPVKQP